MGVDISKKIITGFFISYDQLGSDRIKTIYEEFSNKGYFLNDVRIFSVNPYSSKTIFPADFIVGILEESLAGDGDRAQLEPEKLEFCETKDPTNKNKVFEAAIEKGIEVKEDDIKTMIIHSYH